MRYIVGLCFMVLLIASIVMAGVVYSQAPINNWILICSDPDEGYGANIKAVYYLVSGNMIYFKVVYYREFDNLTDIDTGIFFDVDLNPGTGYNVDQYPGANTSVGAEYVIVIGNEALQLNGVPAAVWHYIDSTTWNVTGGVPADYYHIPVPGKVAIVGFSLDKFPGLQKRVRIVTSEVYSNWDWCPDKGNIVINLDLVVGGAISSDTTALVYREYLLMIIAILIITGTILLAEKNHY